MAKNVWMAMGHKLERVSLDDFEGYDHIKVALKAFDSSPFENAVVVLDKPVDGTEFVAFANYMGSSAWMVDGVLVSGSDLIGIVEDIRDDSSIKGNIDGRYE